MFEETLPVLQSIVSYPETLTIAKLMLAAAMMFVLGMERQKKLRFIGPRTLMLVGCASALFAVMALQLQNFFIIGGVMTGVGFLGGGIITKERGRVLGLTTASLVWMAATIGICVGLEMFATAAFATVFSFVVLRSKDMLKMD
jgi:putative Mg2+ transporter-C (MgtC) family protein